MVNELPRWPPKLEHQQLDLLATAAVDYALSHSIVYRPLPAERKAGQSSSAAPHDASIHAPISLLPSPFPRHLFEQSQALQPLYNDLYARISIDDNFLTKVIGGNVILVDDYQAKLWRIYTTVRQEGSVQRLHLGLFRSDYLLHTGLDAENASSSSLTIKQVELNTISSSFGPLCARVSEMHRYLAKSTNYCGASSALRSENLPENKALQTMAAGLSAGHEVYCQRRFGKRSTNNPVLLIVVQDGERNAFDQRLIEYELLEKHGIRVRRATLTQLAHFARVSEADRILLFTDPLTGVQEEVSVVYFRAGYSPADYPSQSEWDVRLLLERSMAIKCPTVALQLAGAKKVQQVLADNGVIEYFVKDPAKGIVWSEEDVRRLRQSFMPMFGMEEGGQGVSIASDPHASAQYVLKPQREGGGNNVYRGDIPPMLAKLEEEDSKEGGQLSSDGTGQIIKGREAYILMKMIEPPTDVGNYLVRYSADARTSGKIMPEALLARNVVSELGAFGAILFESEDGTAGVVNVLHEHSGGHLLRTKASDSNEGGVAAGFSVIDSPLLVD